VKKSQTVRGIEIPPCPVCDGVRFTVLFEAEDYEYRLPGLFQVSACETCGLTQQSPRPPFDEILTYYDSGYQAHAVAKPSLVARLKDLAINWPRLRKYKRLVPVHGSVLDVGCGSGGLLNFFRENTDWSLHGIEPVAEAAAIGIASGLDIRPTTLDDAAFEDASFDLAMMNHVLEHVPDPIATLRTLRRIVKPGGYLTGEVPTPRCFERWLFGRFWAGYHLPRHLYFFEAGHLRMLLKKAGFQVISVEGKVQPAGLLVSASNLLRTRWPAAARRGLFSDESFVWLALSTPIALAAHLLGSSPSLRFVCRRPAKPTLG
jgi:SAM-dependent methyltransferase